MVIYGIGTKPFATPLSLISGLKLSTGVKPILMTLTENAGIGDGPTFSSETNKT